MQQRHGIQIETGPLRNRRTVWTISTKPFRGAHFAVFPQDLVERCVLAGVPIGGLVLDPFSGSGTSGVVAAAHDLNYIGIEENAEYCGMHRRIEQTGADVVIMPAGTERSLRAAA